MFRRDVKTLLGPTPARRSCRSSVILAVSHELGGPLGGSAIFVRRRTALSSLTRPGPRPTKVGPTFPGTPSSVRRLRAGRHPNPCLPRSRPYRRGWRSLSRGPDSVRRCGENRPGGPASMRRGTDRVSLKLSRQRSRPDHLPTSLRKDTRVADRCLTKIRRAVLRQMIFLVATGSCSTSWVCHFCLLDT
jgi:hypothetical protein